MEQLLDFLADNGATIALTLGALYVVAMLWFLFSGEDYDG